MWSSANLLDWSAERVLRVMSKYDQDLGNLWAPEFVFDKQRQSHLVFWANSWQPGKSHYNHSCDNNHTARFDFWGSYTKDWVTFSEPRQLYDPGCHASWYAPMHYDEGGIDGNMIEGPDGKYYFYYKDSRSPEKTGLGQMQLTSGMMRV
jgi:hypothetical protein